MAKSKRKTISEVEKFYIESNPEGLADQDLADKVKCCVTLVKEIRASVQAPAVKVEFVPDNAADVDLTKVMTETMREVVKAEVDKAINATRESKDAVVEQSIAEVYTGPKAGDYFGRNEKYGCTVMTPVAAEIADAHRKMVVEGQIPKDKLDLRGKGKTNVIHKIRG